LCENRLTISIIFHPLNAVVRPAAECHHVFKSVKGAQDGIPFVWHPTERSAGQAEELDCIG
jgi:hypothetical protein